MQDDQRIQDSPEAAGGCMLVVVFGIGTRRCAIALHAVERVVAAVESAPLSGAPAAIFGIVNIHGTAIPILDVRPRFGEPAGALRLDSEFIIIRTPLRVMALLADHVEGVRTIPHATILQFADLAPGAGLVKGCAAGTDGLTYLYDADALLTAPDDAQLSSALEGRQE